MIKVWSDEFAICPYCGYMTGQLSYEETPEMYDDGSHDVKCPACEHTFRHTTKISYSWETERKE